MTNLLLLLLKPFQFQTSANDSVSMAKQGFSDSPKPVPVSMQSKDSVPKQGFSDSPKPIPVSVHSKDSVPTAVPKEGFLDSLKPVPASLQSPETLGAESQSTDSLNKKREQRKNNEGKLQKKPSGAALVLANQHCNFKPELASPKHDLNLMVALLSSLDFTIAHKNLDRSKSKWDVREMIDDISLLKLEDHCCFLFYYSGHADENGILAPDGHVIPYAYVIQKVGECESLSEKPKIFIFDCSRASLKKETVAKEKALNKSDLPSDCLVAFSASCGGYAFGQRTSGSFFTQDFVKAVSYFCHSRQSHRDLLGVLEEVSRGVREYVPKRSEGTYRQEGVIISTLDKPMWLPDIGKWN